MRCVSLKKYIVIVNASPHRKRPRPQHSHTHPVCVPCSVFLDGCNCPQPPVPDNAAHTRSWCQVLGRVNGGASRQPELAHKSPRRSPTHSIASLGASGILPVSVSVQLRSDTRQCGCWPLRTWTFDVDVAGTSRVPMGVGQSRLLPPAKSCHGGTQGGLRTGRIS